MVFEVPLILLDWETRERGKRGHLVPSSHTYPTHLSFDRRIGCVNLESWIDRRMGTSSIMLRIHPVFIAAGCSGFTLTQDGP